jgi:hypothetical protein
MNSPTQDSMFPRKDTNQVPHKYKKSKAVLLRHHGGTWGGKEAKTPTSYLTSALEGGE